ncbi:uncharacterized protein [Palaemon carinicauda]|uniref:uncharacterized protein n=1 Tax=Palaemon carinicauda TaxID=392227 RepID=UPI0035B68AEF
MTSGMFSTVTSLPSCIKGKDGTNCYNSVLAMSTTFNLPRDTPLHTSMFTNANCKQGVLISGTELVTTVLHGEFDLENGPNCIHQIQGISASILDNTENVQNKSFSFHTSQNVVSSISSAIDHQRRIQSSFLATPFLPSQTRETQTDQLIESSKVFKANEINLSSSHSCETLLTSSFLNQHHSSSLRSFDNKKSTVSPVDFSSPEVIIINPLLTLRPLTTLVSSEGNYLYNPTVTIFTQPETFSVLEPFVATSLTMSISPITLNATALPSSPIALNATALPSFSSALNATALPSPIALNATAIPSSPIALNATSLPSFSIVLNATALPSFSIVLNATALPSPIVLNATAIPSSPIDLNATTISSSPIGLNATTISSSPIALNATAISSSPIVLNATALYSSSVASSSPSYDPIIDFELNTQIFSPQKECRTSLGLQLYTNSKESGFENLLHKCWDILCSEDYPMIYYTDVTEQKTYWFEKSTKACFDSIRPKSKTDYSGISTKARIDKNSSFILLKPSCVQSKGLSYIENTQTEFPFLPLSCRTYLCQVGADILYYGGIPSVLVQPSAFSGLNISACMHEIHKMYHDKKNSLEPESVSVYSFDKYPLESPCPTTIVFRIQKSGTHLIIPFRASWCPPLSRDTWNDLFFSFYQLFQRGKGYRFFKCLSDKSRNWEYHTNRYNSLFQYLLKRNITFPEFPEPCIDFVCDSEIEITHVNQPGDVNGNFWLSYVKYCSKTQCKSLASKLKQCQNETNTKNATDIAKIYYPLGNEIKDYFLYLTQSWSCPNGNGGGGEGQLRAEASANLWLKSPSLFFSCAELLCKAVLQRTVRYEIIAQLVNPNNTIDATACYKHASPSDMYSDGIISIFSFFVNETRNKILFIISEQTIVTKSIGLLGSLYSRSKLELTKCCHRFPLRITQYTYNGVMYYNCYGSNSSLLRFHNCLSEKDIWSVIKIKEELHLVIFRQSQITEYQKKFFEWLAAMDAKLSKISQEFILNQLSFGTHVMVNNIIFAFNFKDNRHRAFITFVSDLQKSEFHCISSDYFTVCSNGSNIFPNSWRTIGYLVIIHNCSVTVTDWDKIVLLLITQFQDSGFTIDYLCQKNTVVIAVQAPSHQVTYSTKGSAEESENVLQMLKTASPSWTWKRDIIIRPWNTLISNGWCVHISDPTYIQHYLGMAACIYYSKNNISIFLQVPSRVYRIDVFPLTHGNKSSVISSFTSLNDIIKWHKTLIITSSDIHSSKEIVLHSLDSAPVYPELTQFYSQNEEGTISSVKVFTKIMIRAMLTNNSQCFEDLIKKRFYYYQSDDMSIIGPIMEDFTGSSCFLSLPIRTMEMLQFYLKHNMTTCNKFWTSCFYNMIITYLKNPPVAIDWDYLPSYCKAKEIALLTVSIAITLVTVVGNLLVLSVIFSTNLIKDETFLLRTSLAIADLLLGIFPATWSVFDHISLMVGKINLQHFDPNSIYAGFKEMSLIQPLGFQQIRFERYGYPVLSCIMFNISANVSLLTLAMMSIETYRGIVFKPLNHRQILGGIFLTWTVGITLSVLVNRREDGWSFTGYFDPITKLTTSMGSSAPSVSLFVFYLQVIVLGGAALIIIIVTIIALATFSYKNHKTMQKLTIHSKMRADKNWKATQTFLLMVALFGVSVIPMVVDVIMDLSNTNPVGHFFSWWLFIAGTSWNWALYSARSSKFGQELRKLLKRRKTNGKKGKY